MDIAYLLDSPQTDGVDRDRKRKASYSSYGQTSQTSPAASTFPAKVSTPYTMMTKIATSEFSVAIASPTTVCPSHQKQMAVSDLPAVARNAYQMLTLETTSGTVQLPTDVYSASRIADEKRSRNATASARFRQRHKENIEKDRMRIAHLEQQVQKLKEELELYRSRCSCQYSGISPAGNMIFQGQAIPGLKSISCANIRSNFDGSGK